MTTYTTVRTHRCLSAIGLLRGNHIRSNRSQTFVLLNQRKRSINWWQWIHQKNLSPNVGEAIIQSNQKGHHIFLLTIVFYSLHRTTWTLRQWFVAWQFNPKCLERKKVCMHRGLTLSEIWDFLMKLKNVNCISLWESMLKIEPNRTSRLLIDHTGKNFLWDGVVNPRGDHGVAPDP